MEYLSDLDPNSRAVMLLLLSIACVEIAIFAFWRIRRLLCVVRMVWCAIRMARQLQHIAREQAKQAKIDLLNQRLGALAAIDLSEGDGELDAAKLVDALEKLLSR